MTRAAIYARYSDDKQNARSIGDQLTLCREIATRHGRTIVATFDDPAVSGANAVNRPGFQAMMQAAAGRAFECIIIEDVDRFARDQAGWHTARKRLDFLGVQIIDARGIIGRLDGSFRALMAEHHIDNLIIHTKRGMAAQIKRGLAAGGLTYGYDAVTGTPGARRINEDQAAIVRRIFTEYVAGRGALQIVRELNAEAIAPPRGRDWRPSVLIGNPARGYGILCNPLYDGRLVWNRVRMVKDPDSGKRLSRSNSQAEWLTTPIEELRIIERETFAEAQRIRAERSKASGGRRKLPKQLLSGLIKCGACGASMVIHDHQPAGPRIKCSRSRDGATCQHSRSYYLREIETRVLAGMRDQLADPRRIELFLKTYREERKRLAGDEAAAERMRERRFGEIDRELARWSDAFGSGSVPAEIAGPKMTELTAERERMRAERSAKPANVVSLHPGAVKSYLQACASLGAALASGPIAGDPQTIGAVRDLIASVTLMPGSDVPALDVAGRLAALTAAPLPPSGRIVGFAMVAGGRLGHKPHPPEPTFRYAA
jgi:site-specific DNA recombinase